VNSGATLTIDPGVIVKFNSGTSLRVNGALIAAGTAGNRIKFTSIEDDSVGGDTSGNGPTVGTPGNWNSIMARSGSTSTLDYVDVTFGGGLGGITFYSTSAGTIDHSTVSYHQNDGVYVSSNADVEIEHTDIHHNARGIYAIQAAFLLGANSSVRDNVGKGIELVYSSSWTGNAPTITHSAIKDNGGYGVSLLVETSVPQASMPTGSHNNLYGNGTYQVYSLYGGLVASDWSHNYWGPDTEWIPCKLLAAPYCPPPPTGKAAGYVAATADDWGLHYWVDPVMPPPPVLNATVHSWIIEAGDVDVIVRTRLDVVQPDPIEDEEIDNSGF
jgi:hypothetical protein